MTIDSAIGSVRAAVETTGAITSGLDNLLTKLMTVKDRRKARQEYLRILQIVYASLSLIESNRGFMAEVRDLVNKPAYRHYSFRLTSSELTMHNESVGNSISWAVDERLAEGLEMLEMITSDYLGVVENLAELLQEEQRLSGGMAINEPEAYVNIKLGLAARREICEYLLQADFNDPSQLQRVQGILDIIGQLSSNMMEWIKRVTVYGRAIQAKGELNVGR